MLVSPRDVGATIATALAVAVFAATYEGWDVWLIGDSHRWAAGAILLLGLVACSLGTSGRDEANKLDTWATALSLLGVAALALGAAAIWTGSLTVLSFLVIVTVVLWAASTLGHIAHVQTPRLPLAH